MKEHFTLGVVFSLFSYVYTLEILTVRLRHFSQSEITVFYAQ